MVNRRVPLAVAAFVAIALPLAACGSDSKSSSDTTGGTTGTGSAPAVAGSVPDGPTIAIGAQDFGESKLLADIYGEALKNGGYPINQKALGGFRDLVFSAFKSGDINFTPEYAASALEFLNSGAGEASGDIGATVKALQTQLDKLGITAFTPAPAVDSNSFVVTKETADKYKLANVSDLTADLRLGGPADCPENASCLPGLKSTYGVDLSKNFVPLDGGGPLTVAALEGGKIDVAILFSTDGVIADKNWVVLKDDKGLINADNITPIASKKVVDAYGADLKTLVDSISAKLTTADLTTLNKRVGTDLEDANVVALDWLKQQGFIK